MDVLPKHVEVKKSIVKTTEILVTTICDYISS
jgi:hypothetical protein